MIGRHLLYIALWYPPSRASGVYRALATSGAFVTAGWDVTVITVNREFLEDEIGSVDPTLESSIPEGVEVERVPFTFWEPNQPELRDMGWVAGNFPRLRKRASRIFPDKYSSWILPVAGTALRIREAKPYHHVLATGNPYASFEAARLVGEVSGVEFSIDYRDPWSFDVDTGVRVTERSVRRAESRIVEESAACFHVNTAIADAYSCAYPDTATKQHVAENGFDAESIGPPRVPSARGPLRFGVLGTVTERWPLSPFFEGWITARQDLPPGSELILGGHLGYFDRSEHLLRSLLPDPTSGVKYVGPVPKTRVSSFYESLDVVVLPTPGGSMVTSGKAYEAVALGVPVVCIQAAGGGARTLLKSHPYAFPADPSPRSVANALVKASEICRTMTITDVLATRRVMAGHERSRAIQPIVATIERLL